MIDFVAEGGRFNREGMAPIQAALEANLHEAAYWVSYNNRRAELVEADTEKEKLKHGKAARR